MKKTLWIVLLLALVCTLALSACDDTNQPQTPNEDHVHAFGEWTTVKDATCTVKGEQERICSCGEKETKSIDATGHTEVIDAAVDPACNATGLTGGKHCSVCNETIVAQEVVAKLEHTPATDAAVEATCSATGLTEGSHCSICNAVIVAQEVVAKKAHTTSDWITDTEATCSVAGAKHKECTVCHTVLESGSIDKIAHTPATDAAVEATCSATGLTEGSHCSVCNAVITAQQVVSKKAHAVVVDLAIEATCFSTGLTEGKHCSVCNATLVVQNVTNKLSHISSAKITDIPETCSDDGSYYIECTLCHSILERGILTGGHSYTQTVIPPTALDKGYTQHKCTRCNDSFNDAYVAALGFTGFAYVVNQDGKTCTIVGLGNVTETEIAIPLTIDGYKVTAIGEQAFAECSNLTKIILQDSIKSIGTRAFYGCTGLTEITIPASVTNIGTQIFYKASNLHTVYYNSQYSSTSNNFLHLSHITKIVFGGNEVPDYILKGSTNITEVVIQESVKAIGYQSFMECKSITSLTIPKSVTEFGWQSFWIASNIKDVYYLGSIEDWLNIDVGSYNSNPLNCGANLYINGELVTEIIVPNTFTKIGYQLCGCTSLVKITIPDTVGIIADDAFQGCTALTNITIPNSVTTIGDAAFYKCSSLTNINYGGTIDEWSIVSKGSSWNTSTGSYTVYCIDGQISKNGTITYN